MLETMAVLLMYSVIYWFFIEGLGKFAHPPWLRWTKVEIKYSAYENKLITQHMWCNFIGFTA